MLIHEFIPRQKGSAERAKVFTVFLLQLLVNGLWVFVRNMCCHLEQIYTDKHFDHVYSQCTVSMSPKVQVYKSITKISWFKTHCRQVSGLKM